MAMRGTREIGRNFGSVSGLYQRARAGYPDELISAIMKASNLNKDCRMLDIGCGTGKSALPFAPIGCKIVALDFSSAMIAEAKKLLSKYRNVEYVVSTLEKSKFENGSFDLAISGAAFHWLPYSAYGKVAAVIKKNGYLAVFSGHSDFSKSRLYMKVRMIRERYHKDYAGDADKFETKMLPDIRRTGLFFKPKLLVYHKIEESTPKQYLDMVATYSWFIALPKETQKSILNEVREFIGAKKGSLLKLPRTYKLILARKR